ncbi:hypothetical protein [Micromonospora endophytica]|uniref:Uncharacterized protein n=1 Tax=Micromonospora endophytica TaxID=515350 RepID=A0A2W2BC57_9ACTN|nr:hypothetical protein [Micromonospora endophytica]PZF82870.1 hypothetical protein C1I93_30410 [Micromonospora endophytica]RIW45049.1 hypothetical protein D3H59_16250 [Micromonospora endophytica]BCJ58012.1 hypothetical protein Jiend_14340 [Micromonospora endophytica]
MERPFIAALLLVGLIIGSGVGSSYARARRGWNDYQTAKKTVPGARRAAWLLIKVVSTKIGVIILLLVGAVAYAAVGGEDRDTPSAPNPSVTPQDRPAR